MTMETGKKVLLTGGNGFLGRKVFDLAPTACEVIVLGRGAARLNKGAQFVSADLREPASLSAARKQIGPVDVIVHLASYVPRSRSLDVWQEAFDTNLNGSLQLIDMFASKHTSIVFASTAEVYGPSHQFPIAEDHSTDPYTFYGVSKLAAEKGLQVLGFRLGLPVCILRFTTIFGPGECFDRAIPNFIRAALQGTPITVYGDGSDLRDYLYIDDAARALWLAVNKTVTGVFNIASGKSKPVLDIARMIQNLVEPPAEIVLKDRVGPKNDYVFNVSKARNHLGFTPAVTLQEGLLLQMDWARQMGMDRGR